MNMPLRCPQSPGWDTSQQLTEYRCNDLFSDYFRTYCLFVPVATAFFIHCSQTCFVCLSFLSTRMWYVVAVGGSRSSSTNSGGCAASNCSLWHQYQGTEQLLTEIHITIWICDRIWGIKLATSGSKQESSLVSCSSKLHVHHGNYVIRVECYCVEDDDYT